MFSQCLLIGTGISCLSTGLYATITDDKYEGDRKNEYITIFTIIIIMSTILMFCFNSSESIVSSPNFEGGNPINYTKPPF